VSDDNKYGKQFLDNYLQAMGGAWRSEAEDAKLVSDPTAYAIENGLPVEEGAVVTLDRSQPDGLFTVDTLLRDWLATPGHPVLHIPSEELIAEADLTDAELETVAGGAMPPVVIACYVG
jgi:hypothetical protein